jgi:hypothetical protein
MENESQSAPPKNGSENQSAKNISKGKTVINLADGNDIRTAKRLVFDPDEDERLVSKIISLAFFLFLHSI